MFEGGNSTFEESITSNAYSILNVTPTRTGYKFLGWATSQTATAQQYVAGQLYKGQNVAPSSITLYAVWAKDSEVQKNK